MALCGTALFIYSDWRSQERAKLEGERQKASASQAKENEEYTAKLWKDATEHLANTPASMASAQIDKDHRLNEVASDNWKSYWLRHHSQLSPAQLMADFDRLKGLIASGTPPATALSQLEIECQNRNVAAQAHADAARANTLAEQAATQHRLDQLHDDMQRQQDRQTYEYQQQLNRDELDRHAYYGR